MIFMEKCTNCNQISVTQINNIKSCNNCGQIEIQSMKDFDEALYLLKASTIDSAYIILVVPNRDVFIEMFPTFDNNAGKYSVNIRNYSNSNSCLSEKVLDEQEAKNEFAKFAGNNCVNDEKNKERNIEINTRFDEFKQLSIKTASKNSGMIESAVSVFWILKNKYPYDDKSTNEKIYSKLFSQQIINELKKINKNAIIRKIDSTFNSWKKLDETHYINMSTGAMKLNFTEYSITVEMFGMYVDDANKLLDVLWQLGFVEYVPDSNEAYVDEEFYNKVSDNNVVFQCRSCGGELKKDGNVYICQQCGEVFKNENAAMDGNVDVQKKAKKINANFSEEKMEKLNNLYTVARRAKNNDNAEQAKKYYDMILVEDPNSWEAVYFTAYFSASQTVIGQISSAADTMTNCLYSF